MIYLISKGYGGYEYGYSGYEYSYANEYIKKDNENLKDSNNDEKNNEDLNIFNKFIKSAFEKFQILIEWIDK